MFLISIDLFYLMKAINNGSKHIVNYMTPAISIVTYVSLDISIYFYLFHSFEPFFDYF